MSRGDAAGASWIVRGDDERTKACALERRGQRIVPARVDAAAAGTWDIRSRAAFVRETSRYDGNVRRYRDQLACLLERLQRPLAWACAGGPRPADAADLELPGADDVRALHRALDPLPAEDLLAISDALIAQLASRTAPGRDPAALLVGEVFEAAAPKVLEAMCSWRGAASSRFCSVSGRGGRARRSPCWSAGKSR